MTPDAVALQRRARRLLPRDAYDYYAGGSGRERTLRGNTESWRQAWLAPRVLRRVSAVDTGIELLGAEVRAPVCVAPTGYQGLAHPDGEVASATGAARAGALFVLSTRSSRRIEEVGAALAAANGSWWFQVYVMRDRELTVGLVRRAAAAGASALVLTADTPVLGRKRRDSGDGLISDEHFTVNLGPLADESAAAQAPDLTFADIGWLAGIGGLPVVVKGVLRGDDASACRAAGAAAVIVSNHGGRQLDGAVPAAVALPGVAAALAGPATMAGPGQPGSAARAVGPAAPPECEVYADGGLRTGEDVLVALALGARAVFVGRPVLWALACGGAEGVRAYLAGLAEDLAQAMALAGAASVADVAGLALPPGRA